MESKNFCVEKFLQEYNTFIEQLENVFKNNTTEHNLIVEKLMKESDEEKLSRGKSFYDSLEDEELFSLFCKSKVKLFSSKEDRTNTVSNSLFGEEFPLKKLVNNMTQKVKDVVWKYLHLFYFLFRLCKYQCTSWLKYELAQNELYHLSL